MKKRSTISYAEYCVSIYLEKLYLKVKIQYNGESTASKTVFEVFNIFGSMITGTCIKLIKRFLCCVQKTLH